MSQVFVVRTLGLYGEIKGFTTEEKKGKEFVERREGRPLDWAEHNSHGRCWLAECGNTQWCVEEIELIK